MAKANILKLLKFDDDVREALISGRRLRNCSVILPTAHQMSGKSEICFIGVDSISRRNGPVVAAAASMCCVNWNEGLKSEVDRLNRGPKAQAQDGRNKLSETLLQQTVWGVGRVDEVQARKIGEVRASQIAMLKAIDVVLVKLDLPDDVALIIDETKTMSHLRYTQLAVSNAQDRSASVAAASVVATTYRGIVLEQLSAKASLQTFAPTQSFAPPFDETHVEQFLGYVTPGVVSVP